MSLYFVTFWGSHKEIPHYSVRVTANCEEDAKAAAVRGYKLASHAPWDVMKQFIKRIDAREIAPAHHAGT